MAKFIFIVIIILGGINLPALAHKPASDKTMKVKGEIVRGSLGKKLDAHLGRLIEKGFSGAVLAAKKDKIILAKGYGFANREQRTPVTTFTVFPIGSVTKQFTAAAVLKLEMQGKLSVNDFITKYFKAVPADKSNYTSGYEQLARVKQLYGKEPWFSEIKGEFTGWILTTDEKELRKYAGQNRLRIPWRHDSVAVLQGISLPTLWIRAEKDRESPMGLTEERLRKLRKDGKPIELVIFPDTDHGMIEFVEAADGKRSYTRFTEGYYRLMFDWIKNRRHPPYGNAKFENAE